MHKSTASSFGSVIKLGGLLLVIGLSVIADARPNYLRGVMNRGNELKANDRSTVHEPDGGNAVGLTILLTGFLLSPTDYQTTIDLLLSKKQTVISIAITNAGDDTAIHVRDTVDAYLASNPDRGGNKPHSYNIIGHSAGGKIALVVAAETDKLRVGTVIALDPVDDNEPRFTNTDPERNIDLDGAKADIYMTYTDGGTGIGPENNAMAIHGANPTTTVYRDVNSSHMCYCDDGGSTVARLSRMFYRPKSGDDEAFAHAQEWVRTLI